MVAVLLRDIEPMEGTTLFLGNVREEIMASFDELEEGKVCRWMRWEYGYSGIT